MKKYYKIRENVIIRKVLFKKYTEIKSNHFKLSAFVIIKCNIFLAFLYIDFYIISLVIKIFSLNFI